MSVEMKVQLNIGKKVTGNKEFKLYIHAATLVYDVDRIWKEVGIYGLLYRGLNGTPTKEVHDDLAAALVEMKSNSEKYEALTHDDVCLEWLCWSGCGYAIYFLEKMVEACIDYPKGVFVYD
jgi:hypothetical protein